MPNNDQNGKPNTTSPRGISARKHSASWNPPVWLEKSFFYTFLVVAAVASIALILWILVTISVPLNIYSREIKNKELTNGQTLRVIYPNLIPGDNKPVDVILILSGSPIGEKASFTITIPSGLTVRQPKAQEYSTQLELASSGSGNSTEPEELRMSLVNSRSEHGLGLMVGRPIVISSPQMQSSLPIDIGVETVPWIAVQAIIDNPANEKNALILLIASLLSGAGTLILQYVNRQRDRSREDQEKRKNEFREQLRENPVDALDVFSNLPRDDAEDSEFSTKKSVVDAFGWEDKLQQIILEKLKSREHYFDAKRAAEVLEAICSISGDHDQPGKYQYSQSLAPFCILVCLDDRKKHALAAEEAECLLNVSKRWHELKPLVSEMLHDFAVLRENLSVINQYVAPSQDGQQLLRDANLNDSIDVHRTMFPEDMSAASLYEFLTYDIHWRKTTLGNERKLSDTILRWLFACFSEPVDTEFSLGAEYAESEDRSRQAVMELPVFDQILKSDSVIVFGGEGTGKTASVLWLMDQYRASTRAGVFPVYAPYESGRDLRDWVVETIARALIHFTADNPQKFISSNDSRKIAMGWLMLWHTGNLETLRFELYISSENRNVTDIEHVIEYLRKFQPPEMQGKLSKDDVFRYLYLARPAGFEHTYFLWDIPASVPVDEVVHKIQDMADFAKSLSRQNVVVKIFAPLTAKEVAADLGSIRHAGDLTWDEEMLIELLNKKMKDKFETLWDRSVDDPARNFVRAAECSPRRLVKLLLRLTDYVDQRHTQEEETLNISVFNELTDSQPLRNVEHSRRQNNPALVNNSNKLVFVSYAWGGESESAVDDLEQAMTESGISIARDKKDLHYKGSISDFEQKIGGGQCVILIISDKYLRSEHCMYELVLVDENENIRDRIFPIVLSDAAIYKAVDRLQYIRHWDRQISDLNQAIKEIEVLANMEEITSSLGKYVRIRNSFDRLSSLLSDMNALTPQTHSSQGFSTLISAVKKRLGSS